MLNMTNAQLHQCVHCSRVGDYDLIIPFTLSLSARTTPSKVPVTTCSSSFHRPEAVKGRKGPVNGRFALAWLLWLPEQKTQPHKQRAIQLNYFRPHFAPKKKKLLQSSMPHKDINLQQVWISQNHNPNTNDRLLYSPK